MQTRELESMGYVIWYNNQKRLENLVSQKLKEALYHQQ